MAGTEYPHLFIHGFMKSEKYTSPRGGGGKFRLPSRHRRRHGRELMAQFVAAAREIDKRRTMFPIQVEGADRGLYIAFQSDPGFEIPLEKLEDRRKKIELVLSQRVENQQFATVFVPDKARTHFLKRFEQYIEEKTKKGNPRHKELVESIRTLRAATLRSLWTDDQNLFPDPDHIFRWEVWLRNTDGEELARFKSFATSFDLTVSEKYIGLFPDRTVVLAIGTARQLSATLDMLGDIAELRKAKDSPSEFLEMTAHERADWLQDLSERIRPAIGNPPSVCVLDTGVNRGHPLLASSLAVGDLHVYNPAWGVHDDNGHGTEMAGLALLGDLMEPFKSSQPVVLTHILESVKILPPVGSNPRELYGVITEESASRVEVSAPDRRRVFSMAITDDSTPDSGRPTAWSATIDALAAGVDAPGEEVRRLFALCAGNRTGPVSADYLSESDTDEVHDPGQAWNALTVGSSTEKCVIDSGDPTLLGWTPLAGPGALSPVTTTSVTWENQWPLKPDVVTEGGNMAIGPGENEASCLDCLSLLTTDRDVTGRSLVPICGTSASVALVARLSALIAAEYSDAWPETIRALVVNSARWTEPMLAEIEAARSRKSDLKNILRRYGHGVPGLQRAIASSRSALTLVAQEHITPFENGKTKDIQFHSLPWPTSVLQGLGNTLVSMRVTLSYFIEPKSWRRYLHAREESGVGAGYGLTEGKEVFGIAFQCSISHSCNRP